MLRRRKKKHFNLGIMSTHVQKHNQPHIINESKEHGYMCGLVAIDE